MNIDAFRRLPLMGILRGVGQEVLEPLLETIIDSGLHTIEIAMNTPDAPELISRAQEIAQGRLTIGAGTVLSKDILKSALESGATFIVLPTVIKDVVSYCAENSIPVFPGALTPHEIFAAWNAGATMVKVFPAKCFGPHYMREVKGPFESIKLLACGGVNPENIAVYFESGADAVAFGGSVFNKALLAQKKFKTIGESLKSYISHYMAFIKPQL